MLEPRKMQEGGGFEIRGANFSHHCAECKQCQRFRPEQPATLALLCLDGAILWKREQKAPERQEPPYNPNKISKEAAKKAMRYK